MIEIERLQAAAGDFQFGPIDLRVEAGAYAVLVGPTGGGKTTLLEAVAGLRPIAGGTIKLGGVDVTHHRPADRHVGYAPQDAALFPTMTVRENLAFGLRARGVAKVESTARVAGLAERLEITPLLDRRPADLSGGERQRVALGRALVPRPDVLLLDEPLSSLDPATQQTVRGVLRDLHAEHAFTALHASHHQEDARALADVVLEMRAGRIAE